MPCAPPSTPPGGAGKSPPCVRLEQLQPGREGAHQEDRADNDHADCADEPLRSATSAW